MMLLSLLTLLWFGQASDADSDSDIANAEIADILGAKDRPAKVRIPKKDKVTIELVIDELVDSDTLIRDHPLFLINMLMLSI